MRLTVFPGYWDANAINITKYDTFYMEVVILVALLGHIFTRYLISGQLLKKTKSFRKLPRSNL